MSKPWGDPSLGISSVDVLILTERHPACRWREAQPGSFKERENLAGDAKGKGPSSSIRKAESTDAGGDDGAERDEADLEGPLGIIDTDPHLAAAFAAVDAANAKAERTLADETRARPKRDPLIYDPDWSRGRPSRPLAHRGRPDPRLAAYFGGGNRRRRLGCDRTA